MKRPRLPLLRLAALAAAIGLLPPRGAAAQASAPTPSLGEPAWRALEDSLAPIRRLEALDPGPRPGEGAPLDSLLRYALVELRRYELRPSSFHFDSALEVFEAAAKHFPDSKWAQYGLARALLQAPELHPKPGQILLRPMIREVLNRDPRTRALRALRSALATDSLFAPAAVLLAQRALDTRLPDDLGEALRHLQHIDSAGAPDLPLRLALARVALAREDTAAAESAARRAVELAPSSALAHLALAQAVFLQPRRRAEGARVYFEGLQLADSAELDAYLRDIEPYLGQHELDALRAAGQDSARAALRRFWNQRAALAAVDVPERLETHYRRLAWARERYRRQSSLAVMSSAFARMRLPSDDEEFDDRGMILVRYGPPDRVISSSPVGTVNCVVSSGRSNLRVAPGCADDVSWYYDSADGEPLALHFMRQSRSDYYLLGSLPCTSDWLLPRLGRDPTVAAYFAPCRHGSDLVLQSLNANLRYHALMDERRERGAPALRKDLPFWYDLETVAGHGDSTAVVAVIGVPIARLTPFVESHYSHYTIHAVALVTDTVAGTVGRAEITRVLEANGPLPQDAVWRFTLELNAPPSNRAVYRIRVEEPATNAGRVFGGPKPVPDYTQPRLALSDILLATPTAGVNWVRDSVQLGLTPTPEFVGGTFTTYYEVYHLPAGATYQTEIEVTPADKGLLGSLRDWVHSGRAISLRFSGQATAPGTIPELRRIQSGLPPGRYRMKVRVTANAQSATTEREFVVKDGG